MKFPKVTVVLVTAALLYVLWDQSGEQPEPVDASRLANLHANPVELAQAVDWVFNQIPEFCRDAGGAGEQAKHHQACVSAAKARTSSCRRMLYERFPDPVATEAVLRDITLTAMECLVPRSGLVQ